MLFDEDPEIGAFLFLNLQSKKIEGFLYRKDEKKHKERVEKDGVLTEIEVIDHTDIYVMSVTGEWFNVKTSTNPFFYHLDQFLGKPWMTDKSKIPWPMLADYIQDDGSEFNLTRSPLVLPYEGRITDIDAMLPDAELDALVAKQAADDAKHAIDYSMLDASAQWILKMLQPQTDAEHEDKKFDGMKKLLKELDKFEYDIGEKKK